MSIHLFSFPFLFSGYFCSVYIVSGRCNQSSATLFHVFFFSLYWFIDAIVNAGDSSSSFFIFIIIYSFRVFHISVNWLFHGSLSDSKSPQVFRTLLNTLAVLNNAVVWMVSARPPTSKSSSPFYSPLVTVPNAPITTGIIVTFMFHSLFFLFPSKTEVLILLFTFFQFYSVVGQHSKAYTFASFLLITIRSGRLAEIRWSFCMSKSHRSLCGSISMTDSQLCIYHLFVWSNLNFWHIT